MGCVCTQGGCYGLCVYTGRVLWDVCTQGGSYGMCVHREGAMGCVYTGRVLWDVCTQGGSYGMCVHREGAMGCIASPVMMDQALSVCRKLLLTLDNVDKTRVAVYGKVGEWRGHRFTPDPMH